MGSSTTTLFLLFLLTVVITPQNGVFNNKCSHYSRNLEVVITPQNGVFNNYFVFIVFIDSCNNPSKWGLQQQVFSLFSKLGSCNNPSKWGLQQHIVYKTLIIIYLCHYFRTNFEH